MIHIQLPGKNKLYTIPFFILVSAMMICCTSREGQQPVRRGFFFISKDLLSNIFIDSDSTYILTRRKGDVSVKKVGLMKHSNDTLYFLDGHDIEATTWVNYTEGESDHLQIRLSQNFIDQYPDAVISVFDTLIFQITDTVVHIDKKQIFNKFRKTQNVLPEYFKDWEVWNRLFVSDLKVKSRKGFLSLFYEGSLKAVDLDVKSSAPEAVIDSVYFKMKKGDKYIACAVCPSKFKFDTLFQSN